MLWGEGCSIVLWIFCVGLGVSKLFLVGKRRKWKCFVIFCEEEGFVRVMTVKVWNVGVGDEERREERMSRERYFRRNGVCE